MGKEVLFSCLSGLAMTLGAAALDSDNPTYQSDAIKANDWLIVGEPYATFTSGDGSLSVGKAKATADYSIAAGWSVASGDASAALNVSVASGSYSFAAGYSSQAIGWGATAINGGRAYAPVSFAVIGNAHGTSSMAIGQGTESYGFETMVMGRYNSIGSVVPASQDPNVIHPDGHLFVIGNGTAWNTRSNALVVLRNGTVQIPSGNLQLGSESALTPTGATTLMSSHLSTNGYLKKVMGSNAAVTNGALLAMGDDSTANGQGAVSFGGSADGVLSFVAGGGAASGAGSVSLGGGGAGANRSIALGQSSAAAEHAVVIGNGGIAMGDSSVVIGRNGNAEAKYAVAIGYQTYASSYASVVLGTNNSTPNGVNSSSWVYTDRLFELGNGTGEWDAQTSTTDLSNAITTLKNGRTTLTNKFWLANTVTGNEVTASNGEALNVEGHAKIQGDTVLEGNTVLKGNVTLDQPQGDISMGIYN